MTLMGKIGKKLSLRKKKSLLQATPPRQNLRKMVMVPVSLLKEARQNLEQDLVDNGVCDHSVNVCVCDLIRLIEDIDAFIAKGENNEQTKAHVSEKGFIGRASKMEH